MVGFEHGMMSGHQPDTWYNDTTSLFLLGYRSTVQPIHSIYINFRFDNGHSYCFHRRRRQEFHGHASIPLGHFIFTNFFLIFERITEKQTVIPIKLTLK